MPTIRNSRAAHTAASAITASVTVVAVLGTGGCTTGGESFFAPPTDTSRPPAESGHPIPGPGAGEIDADRAKQLIIDFAELRKVDPCSLLDRGLIAHLTHATPEPHIPGRHLSDCRVDTHIDEITDSWTFAVAVGVLYKTTEHKRKETVAGEQFYVDSDEDACRYTHMATPDIGVTLAAQVPVLAEPDKPACAMAKSYVASAITKITSMGLRSQRLTKPQLPLPAHDPCESVPKLAQTLDADIAGVPLRPYQCSIASPSGDSPLADRQVTITYEFTTDPREDVPKNPGTNHHSLGTMTAVTIAGHPGSQFDAAGELGCGVNVILDEHIGITVGSLAFRQVISVHAKDCDLSRQVAEVVVPILSAT